ncbi:DUF1835 domain-containing protein [Paenibacillus sp. YYML68]|uniref:DUF1835 domain-containing protein n=1 Tax=Paenibacillus sp. YYML68 TaxID=2909250 RepID=UPI002491C4F1|nr:DUF1835 domain-containing protein [Paenibacillus sp. YYML68]
MHADDLLAIKGMVEQLNEEEQKAYLSFVLTKVKQLKTEQTEDALTGLIELYDMLEKLPTRRAWWDPVPSCTHVHIVTGDSFAGGMKQALQSLDWTHTHKVITLRDHYELGPLSGLDSPEGRQERSRWFLDHYAEEYGTPPELEGWHQELLDKLKRIPKEAEVVLWTCGNAQEQLGMRHALYLLSSYSQESSVSIHDACAMCEELFNRRDAFIHYRHSGEIPPDKLQGALVQVVDSNSKPKQSAASIEQLVQEWQELRRQGGTLRIWQQDAIVEVDADYYDDYVLTKLDDLRPPGDDRFLMAARLIGEVMGHSEQPIPVDYLEYRLREMIYSGALEVRGVPAGMRRFRVRRKSR